MHLMLIQCVVGLNVHIMISGNLARKKAKCDCRQDLPLRQAYIRCCGALGFVDRKSHKIRLPNYLLGPPDRVPGQCDVWLK